MTTNTKPIRVVAHSIATYGFGELQRRIAADRNRTAGERLWSHAAALAAQLVTHAVIEAVGGYFESSR